MRILITAGGTKEYIDNVRILTNISTGSLAAHIAEELKYLPYETLDPEFKIDYIHADNAKKPNLFMETGIDANIKFHECNTVAELMSKMEELVPLADVVIHSMAVSDFTFKRDTDVKLKSNDPEAFVEFMRETITTNPKVLSYIKKWNPNCKLVSFKFEVGLEHEELLRIARESGSKNGSDIIVANDKIEMDNAGTHVAYILTNDNEIKCEGKQDIAEKLTKIITE